MYQYVYIPIIMAYQNSGIWNEWP